MPSKASDRLNLIHNKLASSDPVIIPYYIKIFDCLHYIGKLTGSLTAVYS